MVELTKKIKFDIPYNTQGSNNPEYETEEDMFSYSDVKEAVKKYYDWLNDNVEYIERDRLFNKFIEIFGDFEQLEKDIKEGLL